MDSLIFMFVNNFNPVPRARMSGPSTSEELPSKGKEC